MMLETYKYQIPLKINADIKNFGARNCGQNRGHVFEKLPGSRGNAKKFSIKSTIEKWHQKIASKGNLPQSTKNYLNHGALSVVPCRVPDQGIKREAERGAGLTARTTASPDLVGSGPRLAELWRRVFPELSHCTESPRVRRIDFVPMFMQVGSQHA